MRPGLDRLAPLTAGLAGLAWFWAELAPQREGFPDTDDPALGLQFVAANPTAWAVAGIALGIAAIALIPTVLAIRGRLLAAAASAGGRDPGVDALTVAGLFAAALLFAMAALRLSGGPMLYVRSLHESWGETVYLITQFVGIQLLIPAGSFLLAGWIGSVAWLGARRGTIPRALAALAVLPALRVFGVLGPLGVSVDGLWFLMIAAIPAAYAWLLLLGAWPSWRPAPHPTVPERSPI